MFSATFLFPLLGVVLTHKCHVSAEFGNRRNGPIFVHSSSINIPAGGSQCGLSNEQGSRLAKDIELLSDVLTDVIDKENPKADRQWGLDVIPPGGSRILAQDEKETATLKVSAPLSQSGHLKERDEPLTKDIELLTDILADMIDKESPKVHDLYKQFRQHGLDRTANINDGTILEKMVKQAEKLSAEEALGVMRTFALALQMVNAAEVQHRLRMIKQYEIEQDTVGGPLPLLEDSMRGTIDALLSSEQATKEEIYNQLVTQKVEIVLTAHPTEINRRSLLRKYRKVTEMLAILDRPDIQEFEKNTVKSNLRRIISSVWGSDEIKRSKPAPQQEAAGGLAIIESVLWDAVPAYLRKLDAQCRISLSRRLPADAVPIRFASWIGGDRDGNPNVVPDVTREVLLHQRLRAARLYLNDLHELQSDLAISSSYSDKLVKLAESVPKSRHVRELYRRVIDHLIKRLIKTTRECEKKLFEMTNTNQRTETQSPNTEVNHDWDELDAIYDADELMEPLQTIYESLVETGFELVADGILLDTIRRVAVFGMTLVPLDIREESTKHTEAVDAITRWLGIGSYKEWDEEARLSWLQAELASKRPLFRQRDVDSMGFDATVVKTLKVFQMASEQKPETLGAYVISQAQTASDVLAVMLLQKQVSMTSQNGKMMRVVPLFETLNDLTNAPKVLETLFRIPAYTGAIKGKQEVMVGYSDSAKDAGRLAACWAQYNSQESMVKVASKLGIELTFFHGKGGTVGRGGNPALYRAILSHPPNTINGRFRVTEQGEMITQNFGNPRIAEHTLDIYTAAICRERFTKHVVPKEEWRAEMQKISDISCADYRSLVREEPRFVPYFRQATPELELGSLNIGSRPAKRNPKGGIESLRAIPWTFAWTQTRTHLSAWLGVGEGLGTMDETELKTLREMYKEWPWFRETIDLIAMIVSKTDFSISENYDTQLVEKTEELQSLGKEVREKMVKTRQAVLDVTESTNVGGAHVALLRASSMIRHPYVDPINVIQAELLKRVRTMENQDNLSPKELEEKEVLKDALIYSINGVAQGMRNSG